MTRSCPFHLPAASPLKKLLFLLCWQSLVHLAVGDFLAPTNNAESMSKAAVAERLQQLIGRDSSGWRSGDRIAKMQEVLRPAFTALPKMAQGELSHQAARYALHRHFLVRHGWHIKGLSPETDDRNSTLSVDIIQSRMPSAVIELLEEFIGTDVINLEELATMALLIEDLVHAEAVDLLRTAYEAHGVSPSSRLKPRQADVVIQTFLMFFLWPAAQELEWNSKQLSALLRKASSYYPGWDDTLLWATDLWYSMELFEKSDSKLFGGPFGSGLEENRRDFTHMAYWATEISEKMGRFANLECKQMKSRLLDLQDDKDDGRVTLSKFYSEYVEGSKNFQFSESPEYLRHLGALDESTSVSRVVVPNVLYSKTNCLSTSGFHSLCCIDECASLIQSIEEKVLAPYASPELLATVAGQVSSDTRAAPREFPQTMKKRLEQIADLAGGQVPVHGRLFAEWMHYAFPNECPYPRDASFAEEPLGPVEWSAKWNSTKDYKISHHEAQSLLSREERQHQNTSDLLPTHDEAFSISWSDQEVLLLGDPNIQSTEEAFSLRRMLFPLAAMALVGATLHHILKLAGQAKSMSGGGKGSPCSTSSRTGACSLTTWDRLPL
mmetsp:Transcript_78619/g.163411  ORF Transcript_78619/g.163411 Transcript_78619/m.163411 type:complete len:608 (+) Transcript_78619:160-1983(+)